MTKKKHPSMDSKAGMSGDSEALDTSMSEQAAAEPHMLSSGLKPKLDLIFSEVEKNLPDIDFDFSDVDSESEEPVIFHQHLKSLEEDKDLDTSQSSDVDQLSQSNNSSSLDVDTADKNMSNMQFYDNDLAYALQKSGNVNTSNTGPVSSWSQIPVPVEKDKNQTVTPPQTVSSWGDVPQGKPTPVLNSEEDNRNLNADNKMADSVESEYRETLSLNAFDDRQIQKKVDREKNRRKEQEMVTNIVSPRGPTLSTQFLDNIDLDTLLQNLNNDNQFKPPSPRQAWSDQRRSESQQAAGDRQQPAGATEGMTLIQKLAAMSMEQCGEDLTDIDPSTGAKRKQVNNTHREPGDNRDLEEEKDEVEDQESEVISQGNVSNIPLGLLSSMEAALNLEGNDLASLMQGTPPQPTPTKPVKKSTASCGTNTSDFKPRVLTARLPPIPPPPKDETKVHCHLPQLVMRQGVEISCSCAPEKEPTVFIDLRNFAQIRQEQQQSIERVQQVLGINPDQRSDDSSDSEDDIDDWRKQRQKLKQQMITRPPSSTTHGRSTTGPAPTPPRVINMADRPPRNRQTLSPTTQADMTPAQREEEQRRIAEEREKERRQEIIRQLREKAESERQAKLRLQKRLDALQPTASVNGRHDPAEATPTVFDLEASYEPAPRSLPPVLSHQDTECVLLTINISSNGEIVLHRGSGNKSVDTGSGLSATYTTLLTWLLALVPSSFSYLQDGSQHVIPSPWILPFYVIGLQQVLLDDQLCLEVAVTPVEQFDAKYVTGKNKKSKKVDMKGSSAFQQHLTKYFSTNTLLTVCPWLQNMVSMEVAPVGEGHEENERPGYVYKPPLPNITTKPLSTFIQVNPDPQAVAKVFNTSIGFFWQTIESDESMMDQNLNNKGVSYETQNTISLTYKKIYQEPAAMMGIFNRVLQLGLDLAGVRLVYPTPEQMNIPKPEDNASTLSELELLNNVGAVLAICIRGSAARSLWLDAVGPSDPQLARRTDPNSLCALYGGESRDECLLFCPRTPARVQTELARWFGGRVPPGNVIDVGTPYTKKDSLRSGSPKGRRTKKVTFSDRPDNDMRSSTSSTRPLATLTATARSEIFLVLSPFVPPKCFGILLASCQRRGYQITGIKRCRLSTKKAACLGVPSESVKAFCVGSQPETVPEGLAGHVEAHQHVESSFPSTILQLQKENASHSAASLVEDCMVQLTLQGIMGTIQEHVGYPLESRHMFHAARFSETLLSNIGGDFSRCYDPEVQINPSYIVPELYTNPEVEQVTVLLLLGHDILKTSGLFVGKLTNMMPYTKNPQPLPFSEGLEILGLKWLPGLVGSQAKEVTPYEVGDRMWKISLHELANEPCLVIALRGVNAFKKLESVLPPRPSRQKMGQQPPHLDMLHSRTAEEAYTFIRIFFTERELFSDPMSRPLLPYIPSSVHTSETDINEQKKPGHVYSQEESILEIMLSGPQLLTTFMLIKPRALGRHLPKMLKKITQEGFKIVGYKLLELTKEQAVRFIPPAVQETERQQHVTYLTSAPCLCLSLQRDNSVKKLLDLLGPEDPQSARRQSQFYWRGVFGVDPVHNAVYGSLSYKQSIDDQSLFFPDGLCCLENEVTKREQLVCPAVDTELNIKFSSVRSVVIQSNQESMPSEGDPEATHTLLQQTTCVVLTPILMRKFGSHFGFVEVIEGFVSQGFECVGGRMIWFTQEQAEHFLCLIDAGSFNQVPLLTSGCSIVLALQRDNAVLAFNTLLRETFSSETIQGRTTTDSMLDKYGPMILRPTDIKQAHNLLGFFFDQLIKSSHIQVLPKLEEN